MFLVNEAIMTTVNIFSSDARQSYKSLLKQLVVTSCLLGLLTLTSCSSLTHQEQRIVSGAAIGAGVGGLTSVVTGWCIPCGVLIGAGVGAGTGYVVDHVVTEGY